MSFLMNNNVSTCAESLLSYIWVQATNFLTFTFLFVGRLNSSVKDFFFPVPRPVSYAKLSCANQLLGQVTVVKTPHLDWTLLDVHKELPLAVGKLCLWHFHSGNVTRASPRHGYAVPRQNGNVAHHQYDQCDHRVGDGVPQSMASGPCAWMLNIGLRWASARWFTLQHRGAMATYVIALRVVEPIGLLALHRYYQVSAPWSTNPKPKLHS